MNIDEKKQLGKRIKSIRLKFGDTLDEFGKRTIEGTDISLSATRSLVSAWENGRYVPNPERINILSKLGKMTVEELLYGNNLHPELVNYLFEYCKENSMPFEKDTANFIANKYSTKSFKEDENGIVSESNTPPLSIDDINLINVIKDYLYYSSSYTKEEEDYMKNHTFEYLKDKKERNSLTEFERKLHDKIDKDLHPSRKANQTDMDNF